uniref:Rab-GTPase-TBC_domain_containing_protein_putative /Pfam:PF00566 n=1 Tax=Leishmania donovani TaxID=5661 RepID=A0A6J8FDV3_LEIDO|nr:Rab-GTPase-TBC_domain_containing_protein_putative/Pfam:PF00566 [Leishmania donovani]
MEEDGAVGFLPFCVQRLRGPGRVRRVPPGTAYRSAGALLRRLLRYNEDGEVRVEVVREAVGGMSLGAGYTEGRQTTAAVAAASEELREDPQHQHQQQQQIAVTQRSQPKNQDTKSTRTRSQARRERASILAMETERRYAAEQESRLSFLLQALPLLRVVPPQCLLQQAYTEELVSEPGSDVFTPPNISRSFNPSPPASSSAVVAHRDPSQLGSGSSSSSDVDGDGRNTGGNAGQRGAATATNSYVRGAYRLGLGFAVLLTPEEAAGLHETPPRRTSAQRASTAATAGGSGVGDGKDRTSSLNLLSTVNTTAAPSRAESLLTTVHEEAASTRAAATSRSTDVLAGKPPVSVEVAAESAQAAAAAAATLNGIVIDSGFGVTIKVGGSCDEPNSLRCVAWGGCRPALLRAVVWRLLSDYAPAAVTRQKAELQRKRRQYEGYTRQYCSALTMLSLRESPSTLPSMLPLSCSHGGGGAVGAPGLREAASLSRLPGNGLPPNNGHGLTLSGGASSTSAVTSLSPYERAILQQMLLDLPRHQSPIFHAGRSLAGMARCLFLWSQRHPAVGYVQGMDDVVAVFYHVFLADALRQLARVSAQAATCTRASHRQTATHEGARRTSGTAAAARLDSGSDDGEGDDSDDKAASANGAELGSMACDKGTRAVMRLLVSSLSASVQRTSWSSTAASTPTALATPITMTTLGTPATRATTAAALSPYLSEEDLDVLSDTPAALDAMLAELPESYLTQVEGDTYWCAGRVLSLLQDNFMPGQPGILRNVRRLEALVRAVDPSLIAFLDGYGLTVMDGCFQWLHCLLARELPLPLLLRLWDCYLAIGIGGDRAPPTTAAASGALTTSSLAATVAAQGSSASDEEIMHFHVCVCCALLRNLRANLLDNSSQTSTLNAPAATSGRWGAAALATVLPIFGSRTTHQEGSSAAAPSAADAAACSGTSSTAEPPIDVVMNALKHPFEALFPQYASAKQEQQHPLDREDKHERCGERARARALEAAMRWLDILIADAYCIWRKHPMHG